MSGAKTTLKGLQNFTGSIHRCVGIDKEKEIVNKELAKIRKEFKDGKISAVERRKSVLKMIYIGVLGYEVDTGFVEVIQLLGSNKYADKHIGYLAFTTLFSGVPESTRMIINTLQLDLENKIDTYICDALTVVSLLANNEMADTLGTSVMKLCTGFCETIVKKKAFLALRQLYRQQPSLLDNDPNFFKSVEKLISNEMDIGIINAIVLLLVDVSKKKPEVFDPLSGELVSILQRLVHKDFSEDNDYHQTTAPWLQITLFRILSNAHLQEQYEKMYWDLCRKVLQTADSLKYENPCNEKTIQLSIVFEVMGAIITHEKEEHFNALLPVLGSLVEDSEQNIRYLALDTFVQLGQANHKQICHDYLPQILKSLEEPDITIRRRTIEVLYSLCTPETVHKVVNQLLHLLEIDEGELREELVFNISILAEQDPVRDEWYVDTMLLAICLGGEFIRPELWDRLIVSLGDGAHYAVQKIVQVLQNGCWHEEFLRMSCVILGEYACHLGNLANVTANYLAKQMPYMENTTKRIILTSLVKISKEVPSVRPIATKICNLYVASTDAEVQQRAVEFNSLIQQNVLDIAIAPLPEKAIRTEEENEVRIDDNVANDDLLFMNKETVVRDSHSSSILPNVQQKPMGLNDLLDGVPSTQPNSDFLIGTSNTNVKPIDTTPFDERGYKGSAFTHSNANSELGKKVKFIHKKLLTQNEGVIFQDSAMQIGIRMKCSNVVDVALYVGNTGSEQITGTIALKGENGLNCLLQNGTIQVEPKKQQQVLCRFELKQLFLQAPIVGLSYTAGSTTSQITFSLPVTIHRYVQPKSTGVDFMNENVKNLLGECFVQTQIQSSMQLKDITQLLNFNNYAIVANTDTHLMAAGMVLNEPIGVFIDVIGGSYKIGVGSYKLSLAQVVHDLLTYQLGNGF